MTTIPFGQLRLASQTFDNPRTTSGLADEDIRELAVHIVRHGLLTPLLVAEFTAAGGSWHATVIGGQRRYRAIARILAWDLDINNPHEPGGWHARDGEVNDGPLIEKRAAELREGVPVRVITPTGPFGAQGLALADNLLREGLSSYEVAFSLTQVADQGVSGAELARLIGKSSSWVSRKLSTWRGAGAKLREAWLAGQLTDQVVQDLSELPVAQQERALAGGRPVRGPVSRPGIDLVKDALLELERSAPIHDEPLVIQDDRAEEYAAGVADALRWVVGRPASPQFAKLVGGGE
jgi:ParB-like chromosome segregation protein Spo0J